MDADSNTKDAKVNEFYEKSEWLSSEFFLIKRQNVSSIYL